MESVQKREQQVELSRDERLRAIQADHQAQVCLLLVIWCYSCSPLILQTVHLHEMLNAESTRLAEARNEIHSLSEARKHGTSNCESFITNIS